LINENYYFSDLTNLFSPNSVAVVGASSNPIKVGGRVVYNLLKSDLQGEIYPVNPKAIDIQGLKAYQSLDVIEGKIDVVAICLPAKLVLSTLKQCEDKGVKFIIIATSGFAELGEEGRTIQNEIKNFAKQTGIRIYGPNVPGLFNLKKRIGISISPRFAPETFIPGNVGLATQGGGMGRALLDSNDIGIGFKYWASPGNEADLEIADFIKFYADDDDIDVITILIEGIKNGKKFMEASKYARQKGKSIVALKIGQTASGQQAVLSHTGALAGEQKVIDAVFKQCGIVKANDIDELINLSWLISTYGIRKARRVGIMSFSGGGNGILADKCALNGLNVVNLETDTLSKIKAEMPDNVDIRNPLDLTTYVFERPELFNEFLGYLANDPNTDILIVPIPYMLGENTKKMTRSVLSEMDKYDIPIIPLWTSRSGDPEVSYEWMKQKKKPFFTTFSEAAKIIGIYADHYERHEELNSAIELMDTKTSTSTDLQDELFEYYNLTEYESKYLLTKNYIPSTTDIKTANVEEAVKAANEIGYPVVLKVESKDILHKSDIGGVVVGVENEEEVKEAYVSIHKNVEKYAPNAEVKSILVQEMAEQGLEMILGYKKDPIFGGVIMLGLGGIYVEVLKDITMRALPVVDLDIDGMIEELKGKKLLFGTRGQLRRDIDALKQAIQQFAAFTYKNEAYLSEIDINPLMVYEEGKGVKALDGLVVLNERSSKHGASL